MFDDLVTATTHTSGASAVEAWTRVESAACARRLAAMVTMLDDAYAAGGSASRDQWCLDNWGAVCAHIGAAGRLTSGAASGMLLVATVLRDRLPNVAAVFAEGLIGYPLVRTIVARTTLIKDPEALTAVDTAIATALRTWEPMSVTKTEQTIDAYVTQFDPHALRRTHTAARSRSVDITYQDGSGLAEVFGTLFATDAAALDTRLDALADTVCPADPRTRDQRRADAMGALAQGGDRLACLCDTADCSAASLAPSTGVVVYVVAHQDTLTNPNGAESPDAPDEPGPDVPPVPDGPDDEPTDHAPERPTVPQLPDSPESPEHPEDSVGPAGDSCNEITSDSATDDCAGLDGLPPPMFSKPLRELTLTEALTDTTPGRHSNIPPAAMMGGRFLPGPVARRAALNATQVPILHPGQAPPEPRYTPSKKLADFVRSRDLTCRFPGCRVPATNCDLDHTIPWPYGPTQASNLKCLCRNNHLLKTFWGGENGWRERQFPDGTVVWTAPDRRTYTTTPGSRLLFPTLSEPTAAVKVTTPPPPAHTAGLTMPKRRRTRAEDRARRIDYERELNQRS